MWMGGEESTPNKGLVFFILGALSPHLGLIG